jgi:CubicO group peptidase (beta-lactamase class C family)
LAALKLVEQGKITFDTPVADYLPEFRNPIIVDRTDTQKTSFKPAETIVTLKHILNFTSGLFYPSGRETVGLYKEYSSKEMHLSEDPTSEFFRIAIVRLFFFTNF